MFVAVGDAAIVVSPDGTNWNFIRVEETEETLHSVVFAQGRFVAVGTYAIATSIDGTHWDRQRVHEILTSVAYGNGVFVAVGGRKAYRSADGIIWTEHPFDIEAYFASLTFGAGHFYLALGDRILRSSDGVTWAPLNFPGFEFTTIIHANNRVFAFGFSDGGPQVVSSDDGVEWVVQTTNGPMFQSGVVYDGQRFVAVDGSNKAFISSDGSSWSSVPAFSSLLGIAYANGKFVAVGSYGVIVTSEDGYAWSEQTPAFRVDFEKVVFGSDRFVATDGEHMLMSTNGSNWTHEAALPTVFRGRGLLVHGNGLFVTAPQSIYFSTDGKQWTQSDSTAFMGTIVGLNFGRKKFVAVGKQIATSTDGKAWVASQKPQGVSIKSLAFGKGCFVAGCNAGKIITSQDGITWTTKNLGVTNDLHSISFERGEFRIRLDPTAWIGQEFVSLDGVTWIKTASYQLTSQTGVIKGSVEYAGLNLDHQLVFSYDGEIWSRNRSPRVDSLKSIAFGKNTFVAVGNRGAILQSDPLPDCSGSVSPRIIQLDHKGGEVNVNVAAADECAWSVWNKHEWITDNSVSNGMGNGTVSLSVSPNDSTQRRTAVLSIAGQNLVLSQDPPFASNWPLIGKTLLLHFDDSSPSWTLHMRIYQQAYIRVRGEFGTKVVSYGYSQIDSETAYLAFDASVGFNGTLSFIDRRNGSFAFTNAQNTVHTGTFELFASEPSYNNDAVPNILWQADNNTVTTWNLEGTNFLSSTRLHSGATGVGWRVVGGADFNNDGFGDILWQHQDRRLVTWLMTGAQRASSTVYPLPLAPLGRIVAAGDVFGGYGPDFLLQEDTGRLWAMGGYSIYSLPQLIAGGKTFPGWRVVGMRDFNYDGRNDILFQNAAGRLAVWYLDGVHLIAEEEWDYDIPAHRRVAALIDLDQNGTSDLIFRSPYGSVGVWFMDGKTRIGSAPLRKGSIPGSHWRLIGPK